MVRAGPGLDDEPSATDAPNVDEADSVERRWSWFPVSAYAVVAGALWLVAAIAFHRLGRHVDPSVPGYVGFEGDGVAGGWFQWDGNWYREIARDGYTYRGPGVQSSVAYFPAYPMVLRLVALTGLDVVLAGVLVTVASGLGVAVLFYRWCCDHLGPTVARAALITLLVYPYAWYLYGAVYADALFAVAALAAFVLLERDRPVLAGLAAAVATAARPVGIGVVIGLVAVAIQQREVVVLPVIDAARDRGWRAAWRDRRTTGLVRIGRGSWRAADWGVLLAPLGLVAWLVFLARAFGDPFLFAEVQRAPGWDQGSGPSTWFKVHWIDLLSQYDSFVTAGVLHRWDLPGAWTNFVYTTGITVQAAFVLGSVALIPRVARRVGWGYAVYLLGVLALPILGSKDWQGTGRYLLAAFPVFAVVGELLVDRPVVRRVWWALSALALLVLTQGFARGYYLA